MKITKYALGKEYENKQIFLDNNGETYVVHVMPRGLQLLPLGSEQPTLERTTDIFKFCHEFIDLYNEEEAELEALVKMSAGESLSRLI